VPCKEPAGDRDWVRFESKIVLDQRHIGLVPQFFLGETPTVPWRQRDGIADLSIAHGRTSLRGERMGPRGRRAAEDQTIAFRRRAPGKQDFWPISAASGSEVLNRTVGGTAAKIWKFL
jgi:hypothetical protein